MTTEAVYYCVGICLPDADEAYCIGCGRPWDTPAPPLPPPAPASAPTAVPPAPTLSDDARSDPLT